VVGAAMVMFFMAAMIEGFLSPSGLPYEVKMGVALVSSCLLGVYFIVLGFPSWSKNPEALPSRLVVGVLQEAIRQSDPRKP